MKKLILFVALFAMSILSKAQDNQLVWANGKLLYGTPMESIDSMTYDEMRDIDTLRVILPKTLIQVVYDTIVQTEVVYDTIIQTHVEHDTIIHIQTEIVHDTIVQTHVEHDTIIHIQTEIVHDTVTMKDTLYIEAVDMGLGVKWAKMNIGARAPEDYGDFFAWGETKNKSEYKWSTYKWGNGGHSNYNKYNTNSTLGIVDNNTTIDPEDDAATVRWNNWRLPTKEEIEELRNNCYWDKTIINGITGYKATSKRNGNSIFFPTAGHKYLNDPTNAGSQGYYWSSSLNSSGNTNYAHILHFDENQVNSAMDFRCFGLPIRAVRQ